MKIKNLLTILILFIFQFSGLNSYSQQVQLTKIESINLPSYPHYLIYLKFNFNDDFKAKDKIYLFDKGDTTRVALDTNNGFAFLAKKEQRKFNLHIPVYGDVSFFVEQPSSQSIFHFTVNCRDTVFDLPEVRYDFGKPVIYLYSNKKIEAQVELSFAGDIYFTYPIANDGHWECTVEANGQLVVNGQKHNYLFWEGKTTISTEDIDKNIGYKVKTDTLISFFENTLNQLNFNADEREDFITYWGPKMIQYDYVNIQFWTHTYEKYAQLKIQPKPDQIARFFMVWSESNNNASVRQSQKLQPIQRKGFHVLEWGGTEVEKKHFNTSNL